MRRLVCQVYFSCFLHWHLCFWLAGMSLDPTRVIPLAKSKPTGTFIGHVSWQSFLPGYKGIIGRFWSVMFPPKIGSGRGAVQNLTYRWQSQELIEASISLNPKPSHFLSGSVRVHRVLSTRWTTTGCSEPPWFCSEVDFDQPLPLKIINKRFLAFLPSAWA